MLAKRLYKPMIKRMKTYFHSDFISIFLFNQLTETVWKKQRAYVNGRWFTDSLTSQHQSVGGPLRAPLGPLPCATSRCQCTPPTKFYVGMAWLMDHVASYGKCYIGRNAYMLNMISHLYAVWIRKVFTYRYMTAIRLHKQECDRGILILDYVRSRWILNPFTVGWLRD